MAYLATRAARLLPVTRPAKQASWSAPSAASPLLLSTLLSSVCRGETALNACQALPFPTRADSSTWHACNIVVVARVAGVIVVVVHAVTESWPGCLYLDAVRQLPAEVALRSSLLPDSCCLLPSVCCSLTAQSNGFAWGIKFL